MSEDGSQQQAVQTTLACRVTQVRARVQIMEDIFLHQMEQMKITQFMLLHQATVQAAPAARQQRDILPVWFIQQEILLFPMLL